MGNLTATLICLGIGLLLFIVEMFTPGMGVAGILGAIALFAAIMLQIGNPIGILFMIALVLFLIAVAVLIFFRLALKGKFDRTKIVLSEQIQGESTNLGDRDMQEKVGNIGIAATALRPAGKADFESGALDVATGGEFLPAGTKVRIERIDGLRILVRALTAEE